MMKNVVKRTIRDERGNVLILVLVLLVVGGLILTPLLGLMSTGLVAGQVYEKKTAELYAADAGVEDAIWKIQNSKAEFNEDGYYSYPEQGVAELWVVNDKSVDVEIYREDIGTGCHKEFRYQILSTATAADGGSTTVEAYLYVLYMDFSMLLDYAIISYDTIELKSGTTVDGDVWLPIADEEHLDNKGVIIGEVKDQDDESIAWPTAEQLSTYYIEDVEGTPDPGPSIDIKDLNPKAIGPCYREWSLAVDNTGDEATLVLEDTIYVTGDLEFQQSGSHNYTIDLNGHTIFVEGEIDFPSVHVSISGSGCIIAIGDIDFQPAVSSESDDFVLVMSIEGTVNFQPTGEFTGCIAGDSHVQLQPGTTLNWTSPEEKPLNFPMGDDDEGSRKSELSIESWQIK